MNFAAVAFPDVADVEALHAIGIRTAGGTLGIRDRGLLASAVMRPRATFDGVPLYPSLAAMAAALLVGLARNHPFLDGNKRAAFLAAFAFLEVNGRALVVGDEWIAHVEAVAVGVLDVEAIADLVAAAMGGDPVAVEP